MQPHTGFIVAAFLATALLLAGMVAVIVLDYRVQRRELARLAPGPANRATQEDEPI
jgi:heme exporter protein D